MPKTRKQTIDRAHQHLGINATGESTDTAEYVYADDTLDGVVGELLTVHGVTVTFPIDDDLFLPVSHVLATEIAPHYDLQAPLSRSAAIMRVRSVEIADDRTDYRDTDNDGLISDDEAAAGIRALYY